MSSPPKQYPNQERKYPNHEPAPADEVYPARPTFEPSFEADLYRLAPSRVTVLLLGGSASLKRAVALALHERSPRAAQPFIGFDCAGRDSDTVEALLFGGPVYAPVESGAIHEAGNGTLFVTAIDELPLLMQPRFLRFLDQERLVRVVASTDIELPKRVDQGHFRLDLAERLTLVELVLPESR
jgi:DNA-binding NtrC family response regulator